MGTLDLKEKFSGRESWRSLNCILVFVMYAMMFIIIQMAPQYTGWMFVWMGVFLVLYGWIFEHHLRMKEKEKKGNKVIEGWITHAYAVGEKFYLYPVKFLLEEKLSDVNLETVKNYIAFLKEKAETDKTDIGLGKFQPKQLPLKEITKRDIKDEKELIQLGKKEREEFEMHEQEYKERKAWQEEKERQLLEKENNKEPEIIIKEENPDV